MSQSLTPCSPSTAVPLSRHGGQRSAAWGKIWRGRCLLPPSPSDLEVLASPPPLGPSLRPSQSLGWFSVLSTSQCQLAALAGD